MERKFVGRALGLAVVFCTLMGGMAQADVFNLGGTRNPDGSWNGTASLETVAVGNPGNAKDITGYGRVDYAYNIGKYEVTAGQYTAFLNAVATSTDTFGLYNSNMWSNAMGCKIQQIENSGSYSYSVASDYVNRPVNFVSFWDACRFANWLNNGQQGAGTTEYGTYDLSSNAITNNTVFRNSGSTWAVTSEDEWYKAAYFNQASGAGYYLYPTTSDAIPGRDVNDVSGNNANYYVNVQGAAYLDPVHFTTLVGEFQNSDSPYGTFDQGGNVEEWNEAIVLDLYRGTRNGCFFNYSPDLLSSYRDFWDPTAERGYIGFRVSEVPEPASLGILGVAVVGMLFRRRGLRR